MGADYYSYAVIGMEITDHEEKLWIHSKQRAFNHNYPETMNFDPKTGKKLWEEIKAPAVGVDEYGENLLGFKLVYGTNQESCFVAGAVVRSDYAKKCDTIPDIQAIKKEMQAKLETLGLWDESKFGLWSILYCSY